MPPAQPGSQEHSNERKRIADGRKDLMVEGT
jgi:hypothetical protein